MLRTTLLVGEIKDFLPNLKPAALTLSVFNLVIINNSIDLRLDTLLNIFLPTFEKLFHPSKNTQKISVDYLLKCRESQLMKDFILFKIVFELKSFSNKFEV